MSIAPYLESNYSFMWRFLSAMHTEGLGTPALDGFLNNAIDNELENYA